MLNVEQVFPGRMRRRWKAPARIYFPELTAEPRSFTVPVTPREALLRLFPHSCFVVVKPDLTPDHLQALSTLVDNAPAARLISAATCWLRPTATRNCWRHGRG